MDINEAPVPISEPPAAEGYIPPEEPSTPAASGAAAGATAGIATGAALIALGNVGSRLLGMVREMALFRYYGASGMVSAFTVAAQVPQLLYDMLIGGLISSALVPVFSEYAERSDDELSEVVSIVLSISVFITMVVAIALSVGAATVATLIGGGLPQEYLDAAVGLLKITSLSIVFLGLSGVISGVLFAMRRFVLPAFVVMVFNAALIVAIVVSRGNSIAVAASGLVIGALLQVVLQLPGLRGLKVRFRLDWRHPALRRIALLYLPMLLGIAVAQFGALLDRRLASGVHPQAIAWMRAATTLQQFPQGLVTTAVSMAALPTLARQANDLPAFRRTLGVALRMVLVLIVPMVVALFLMAEPAVALIFQRGLFLPEDTAQTSQALRVYLLGLPFAAIDLPLVYAFYARNDTLTPNLVAILGVIAYLVVALPLIAPLGFIGLVAANSAQLTAHALVMLYLAHRRFDALRGQAFLQTFLKLGIATLGMALAVVAIQVALPASVTGILRTASEVFGGIILGSVVFLTLARILRIAELETIGRRVAERVRPGLTRPST
ncbi:MAG: murein biosynthesis integral membrane protein MurJ [Anaerolineae bacterium]